MRKAEPSSIHIIYTFAICGDLFPNEQAQIHCVQSFFKADRAACFSNKVLRTEAKGKGPYFWNWTTFSEMFMELLCPKNEQLAVLTRLEGTSWYQAHQQKDLSIIFEYIYYNVLTDGQIYISLIHTLIRLYISIP